jgi:hypothetical protein
MRGWCKNQPELDEPRSAQPSDRPVNMAARIHTKPRDQDGCHHEQGVCRVPVVS